MAFNVTNFKNAMTYDGELGPNLFKVVLVQ